MDLQRALWLRWSARWLIHTGRDELLALFFFLFLCPRYSVHVWFTSSVLLPKHASSRIRALSAWLASLPRSALLISWFHTLLLCLQRHTSRISRTDLNATWHGYSPETVYSLMQDTLGCLHRPQSNNTNHQPAWERGLLQRHAVPIEFSEVWRRVWRKRCEDWLRKKHNFTGWNQVFLKWNDVQRYLEIFRRPLWWSTGRVSVPNLTPLIFSTDKMTSRKDSRLRFRPRPRWGQDDVNGLEQPTRAELKPITQHIVTSEHQ